MLSIKLQKDERLYCTECGREITSPNYAYIYEINISDEVDEVLCGSCDSKR